MVGPLRAKQDSGAYRIGIAIEARTGPGESLPAATRDALELTWEVTADTVRGIGHLAAGRDTNQVSSSVGIVRVSAQAWRQGLRDFLFVLGLVSLALGLLNLLPVLPLDGGHIVMALVEKVRGRTFRQAVYIRYSVVGLTLFAVLMYFGLRNDLFGGGRLALGWLPFGTLPTSSRATRTSRACSTRRGRGSAATPMRHRSVARSTTAAWRACGSTPRTCSSWSA